MSRLCSFSSQFDLEQNNKLFVKNVDLKNKFCTGLVTNTIVNKRTIVVSA